MTIDYAQLFEPSAWPGPYFGIEDEVAAVADGRKPISLHTVEVGDGREVEIRELAARFDLPVAVGGVRDQRYSVAIAHPGEQWRMLANEEVGSVDVGLHTFDRSRVHGVILGYTAEQITAHVAHRRASGRIVAICPEEDLACDLSRFVIIGVPARLRLRADAPARLASGQVLLTVAVTHELERSLWGATWLELNILTPPPEHLTIEGFNRNITENFERVE